MKTDVETQVAELLDIDNLILYARSSTGKAIFSFVSAIHPQRPTRPPRPQ